MQEPLPWRRIVIEVVVIVGSILLAFGIDAAWDARGEAARRRAVIQGLTSDYQAVRRDLDRVSAFHTYNRSGAADPLALSASGRSRPRTPPSRIHCSRPQRWAARSMHRSGPCRVSSTRVIWTYSGTLSL